MTSRRVLPVVMDATTRPTGRRLIERFYAGLIRAASPPAGRTLSGHAGEDPGRWRAAESQCLAKTRPVESPVTEGYFDTQRVRAVFHIPRPSPAGSRRPAPDKAGRSRQRFLWGYIKWRCGESNPGPLRLPRRFSERSRRKGFGTGGLRRPVSSRPIRRWSFPAGPGAPAGASCFATSAPPRQAPSGQTGC